jgi:hypothetical protein
VSSYVVQQRRIEDVYTLESELGMGAFGFVVLAQPKSIDP